jgi:hypothetical protein
MGQGQCLYSGSGVLVASGRWRFFELPEEALVFRHSSGKLCRCMVSAADHILKVLPQVQLVYSLQ